MKRLFLAISMSALLALVPTVAFAGKPVISAACDNAATAKDNPICQGKSDEVGSYVTTVVNTLLWAVGILAVIMIIWGGIKYITSAGDASKLKSAKDTILYSVIGLIVAIFAFAIVAWIDNNAKIAPTAPSPGTPSTPSDGNSTTPPSDSQPGGPRDPMRPAI